MQSFVDGSIGESHTLEFKRSDVIKNNQSAKITKEISAFANSAGGDIYIGLEEESTKASNLDDGSDGEDKSDWIETIIARHIKPVLIGVEIVSEKSDTGWYYKIKVPKSADAPHQSHDNKYYKRSGTHSLPMEHYEIEDIRYRSAIEAEPLDVRITTEQSSVAVLRVENIGQLVLKNVSIKLRTVFSNAIDIPDDLKKFSEIKYSFLYRETVHRTWLGVFHEFFSGKSEERLLYFDIDYETPAGVRSKTLSVDLNDYKDGLTQRALIEEQLKEIVKVLKGFAKEQKTISKNLSSISQAFEPTGMRVAHTSLKQLNENNSELSVVNPLKVGEAQVAEILGLPNDQNNLLLKFLNDWRFRKEGYKDIFDELNSESKSLYLKFFDDPMK